MAFCRRGLTSPMGRGRIASAMRSIVRCNPGEGLGSNDRPYPLTPTLSPWERGRTSVAASLKQNTLHLFARIDAAHSLMPPLVEDGCAVAACGLLGAASGHA